MIKTIKNIIANNEALITEKRSAIANSTDKAEISVLNSEIRSLQKIKEKAEDRQRGFNLLLYLYGMARIAILGILRWCKHQLDYHVLPIQHGCRGRNCNGLFLIKTIFGSI